MPWEGVRAEPFRLIVGRLLGTPLILDEDVQAFSVSAIATTNAARARRVWQEVIVGKMEAYGASGLWKRQMTWVTTPLSRSTVRSW